ncbi:hypothetical protein [Kitasatospora aureofaciens]|uniref:hypothetical protein n=1 Tax=Kitasatospora aureofaciens TaxID=1894 RepID=UPI00382B69DA
MSGFTQKADEGAALTPEGIEGIPNTPVTVRNDMSGTVSGPVVQASQIGNVTINYNAGPPPMDSTPGQDSVEGVSSNRFEPVPRSLEQINSIVSRRSPAWEYLAYAGYLHVGMKELESRWLDYSLGHKFAGSSFSNAEDLSRHVVAAFREVEGIAHQVGLWLSPDAQARAFGAPGESGDPVLIEHLARRLVGAYGGLIDWSIAMRSVRTPEQLSQIVGTAARFADRSIKDFRLFVVNLVERLDGLSVLVEQAPTEPIFMNFSYVMDIDSQVLEEFQAEIRRVKRLQRRWF